ncbi:YlbF family regulator [Paenibacillus ihumii]|uniref:YlbF family regulator n=1 Tax=Paenibacillus ihumii TaxID=687436 RepID=UPI0006D77980|nr:YlbF family regulator [Paenibacillus ihumii]
MSVTELKTVDMAQLLTYAYELGDMINNSTAVSEYLYWKRRVEEDAEIQVYVRKLAAQKELFEETERFGHYHPNYHEAKDRVAQVEKELEQFEAVRSFKAAEKELDDILHQMSETIAYAVSDTIKVPSNDPNPKAGGCGSGGKCSCG